MPIVRSTPYSFPTAVSSRSWRSMPTAASSRWRRSGGRVAPPSRPCSARRNPRCGFSPVPGSAAQMSRAAFNRAMKSMPAFRALMFAYVQAFLEQVMVSVACNGAHSLKERLARWLLMMRDRNDDDAMPLTQDLLAEMLGVPQADHHQGGAGARRSGSDRARPASRSRSSIGRVSSAHRVNAIGWCASVLRLSFPRPMRKNRAFGPLGNLGYRQRPILRMVRAPAGAGGLRQRLTQGTRVPIESYSRMRRLNRTRLRCWHPLSTPRGTR